MYIKSRFFLSLPKFKVFINISGELDDELTNITKRQSRTFTQIEESPTKIITSALKDVEEISQTISEEIKR